MMFQVSDLRPSFCEIRDLLAPSCNNDQENIELPKKEETEEEQPRNRSRFFITTLLFCSPCHSFKCTHRCTGDYIIQFTSLLKSHAKVSAYSLANRTIVSRVRHSGFRL